MVDMRAVRVCVWAGRSKVIVCDERDELKRGSNGKTFAFAISPPEPTRTTQQPLLRLISVISSLSSSLVL